MMHEFTDWHQWIVYGVFDVKTKALYLNFDEYSLMQITVSNFDHEQNKSERLVVWSPKGDSTLRLHRGMSYDKVY